MNFGNLQWPNMENVFNDPYAQLGMGILAANRPGSSFGQAVGEGALIGMQQYRRNQIAKSDAELRKMRAQVMKQQIEEAKRKAQMTSQFQQMAQGHSNPYLQFMNPGQAAPFIAGRADEAQRQKESTRNYARGVYESDRKHELAVDKFQFEQYATSLGLSIKQVKAAQDAKDKGSTAYLKHLREALDRGDIDEAQYSEMLTYKINEQAKDEANMAVKLTAASVVNPLSQTMTPAEMATRLGPMRNMAGNLLGGNPPLGVDLNKVDLNAVDAMTKDMSVEELNAIINMPD